MTPTMAPYRLRLHVFVCTKGDTCPTQGSVEVHQWLKRAVKERLPAAEVRVNQAGCFSQCGHGPMIAVYPDNVWYAHVTMDDARRILDEHILGGRPVADLVYRNPPGPNQLPRDEAKRVLPMHPAYRPCPRCPSVGRPEGT